MEAERLSNVTIRTETVDSTSLKRHAQSVYLFSDFLLEQPTFTDQQIEVDRRACVALDANQKEIGVCVFRYVKPKRVLVVEAIAVDQFVRRERVATRIIEHVHAIASKLKAKKIESVVDYDHVSLQCFFRSIGFVSVSLPETYQGRRMLLFSLKL